MKSTQMNRIGFLASGLAGEGLADFQVFINVGVPNVIRYPIVAAPLVLIEISYLPINLGECVRRPLHPILNAY